MDKLSIIIPVYYNQETLYDLYDDISKKVINILTDVQVELIFVDDGSGDKSFEIVSSFAKENENIKAIKLSKNFGSHSAILCGLSYCTGDCAVVKAADLQEPTELIIDMYKKWREGNKVVLGVRKSRDDGLLTKLFADAYYKLVKNVALSNMPKNGFDVYLLDRLVIDNIVEMDEKNTALTGLILWSGFKTTLVSYERRKREKGKSRWTFQKKVRLFNDTLFAFTSIPISLITIVGILSILGAIIWTIVLIVMRLNGEITVEGWTSTFIFTLFSFGLTMITLGLLGGYIWRGLDASRNRPVFIVEETKNILQKKDIDLKKEIRLLIKKIEELEEKQN